MTVSITATAFCLHCSERIVYRPVGESEYDGWGHRGPRLHPAIPEPGTREEVDPDDKLNETKEK